MIFVGSTFPGGFIRVGANGHLGFTPAQFAADGTQPSPLAAVAEVGDTDTEFLWVLQEPLIDLPMQASDAGGVYVNAVGQPDGVRMQRFRLVTCAPGEDAVDRGLTHFLVSVGNAGVLVPAAGGLSRKAAPGNTERRLYLTAAGETVARIEPATGDRLLAAHAAGAWHAGAPAA